jgi:hypothetical protein
MEYEQFKRTVIDGNWWCAGSPLAWTTENPGIGLNYAALDGQVGRFNLCWLMLQRTEPPPLKVYQQTDMRWVVMMSGQVHIDRRTLLEHASFKTLDEFNALIVDYSKRPGIVMVDTYVPWRTLLNIAERSFT